MTFVNKGGGINGEQVKTVTSEYAYKLKHHVAVGDRFTDNDSN
ncbi:hypothetical protein [Candidatus Pseudomonas adelgestsugas]|uniref:Uncharacterized protein n=1 Tax=Candidatus Pseudomonas adelgestsugas TaxID=1302376 RepID=A0ABX5R8H3_9PSED|nr:hypothetical protein C3B55_00244 [Candidatus Pseudomonas adelgestsugas]